MHKNCQYWQLLMIASDIEQQNKIKNEKWPHLIGISGNSCRCRKPLERPRQVTRWYNLYLFHFCKLEIYGILNVLWVALHQEIVSGLVFEMAVQKAFWFECYGAVDPYISMTLRYKILRNIEIQGHFRKCNIFLRIFFSLIFSNCLYHLLSYQP